MPRRVQLYAVAYVVGGTLLVLLWWEAGRLEFRQLRYLGVSQAILLITGGVFDQWLWRWKRLSWFTRRPVLAGTWMVRLRSDWEDPEVSQPVDPITCYVAVRQTYLTLSMRLLTAQSSSTLLAQGIVGIEDGWYRVAGVYLNTPGVELRGVQSEMHYGALLLEVCGTHPSSFKGEYWTDRKTRGSLSFIERRSRYASSYQAAAVLFGR